jgi:tetratricopeptide (TPR) repeat protein
VALEKLGRHDDALASFEDALAIKPDITEALYNRGIVLANLDRYAEALEDYDQALAIKPDHIGALNNRGVALSALDRDEEAIASFDKALAVKPDFAQSLLNRGLALASLGRHGQSIVSYDQALAIDPCDAEALFNRGTALAHLDRPADAIISFEKAIAVKPNYADAISNRGVAFGNLNRQREAIASFRQAIAIAPGHPQANLNESLAWLRLGDFHQGWAKYEARWAAELAAQRRTFAQPLWLGGDSLRGKTILLHAEQGLGDTIQFVRYAPLVAQSGAQIVLEVQPPLEKLLSRTEGISQILGKGKPLPDFDVHCPLLSLPLAFRTDLDTIPAEIPYVVAPEAHVARWRDRLAQAGSPRVGIAWAGSATNKNDRNRSIALERFADIFAISGVHFVSLQKGLRRHEREILDLHAHITHVGDELEDFTDTAAVISLLDLVVAVDTSVAHLVGAMAKPVWILVPFAPDFRWMLDCENSPWYPTARLLRQPSIGDWDSVLGRVRRELSGWMEAHAHFACVESAMAPVPQREKIR